MLQSRLLYVQQGQRIVLRGRVCAIKYFESAFFSPSSLSPLLKRLVRGDRELVARPTMASHPLVSRSDHSRLLSAPARDLTLRNIAALVVHASRLSWLNGWLTTCPRPSLIARSSQLSGNRGELGASFQPHGRARCAMASVEGSPRVVVSKDW
jgi:hypothetical protein